MRSDGLLRSVARGAGPWVLALLVLSGCALAQETGFADPHQDVHALLFDRQLQPLRAIAAAELDDPEVPLDRKLEILRALATLQLLDARAHGDEELLQQARVAMITMLRLDPRADFVPGHRYPEPVHELFRDVRAEQAEDEDWPADPRRVAVAPFYLVDLGASGTYAWDAFCAALPYLITTDLQPARTLTLLSREHLDTIRAELALSSQAELLSPETRARLGRLLAASSFIYGEVQALPGDEVYLAVRWVQTETGAVLVAEQANKRVRKGSDLVALEREVVVEAFLPRMLSMLAEGGDDGEDRVVQQTARARDHFRRRSAQGLQGDTYLRYVAAVARAVQAEEQGDTEAAARHWAMASDLMPEDETAAERVHVLRLQMSSRETPPPEGSPE